MPSPTVQEWTSWLPASMLADPASQRFVAQLLEVIHAPHDYLHRKIEALPDLLDPAATRDDLVGLLAATVGLGSDLAAVNAASVADLRRLITRAVALWKRKGTRASWRDLVASLGGSRSLILDWFHHRLITGSGGEIHTLPRPGSAPGGWYDYPEQVSDVWWMDPDGDADGDLLAAFLEVVRPNGERINLYLALLLDDMLNGSTLWTPTFGASGSGGYDSDELEITAAVDAWWAADVGGGELAWSNYHAHLPLKVTGDAEVYWYAQDRDDGYRVAIKPNKWKLERVNAGTPTTLASGSLPVSMNPDHVYRWSFEGLDLVGGTQLRIYWEGQLLVDYSDTSGSRHTAGTVIWGVDAAGGAVTLTNALVWAEPITPVRIGPNP
jgi:phage tail-like protein